VKDVMGVGSREHDDGIGGGWDIGVSLRLHFVVVVDGGGVSSMNGVCCK